MLGKRILGGVALAAGVAAVAYTVGRLGDSAHAASTPPPVVSRDQVDLTDAQRRAIKIGPATLRAFAQQETAVGSIDFDENRAVPVFTSYAGKIVEIYADVGDDVKRGQPLFAIASPDLTQAESALLAARGVYELTSAALVRNKQLYVVQGIAQKDYEQSVSDQTTAEANLKAARNAVRIFGKSDPDIRRIEDLRVIDAKLVVTSPIAGRVTARAAQPGLLVQPGNAAAPFTVADVSKKWMLANVPEGDSPLLRVGQTLDVAIAALPGRHFPARIQVVGATVDANTHTVQVRAEVGDPARVLRPGMLAQYAIHTGAPQDSVAVPTNAVVREGDGSMTVWTTRDDRHFTRRSVAVGSMQGGYDQITRGLAVGERVASDGAVFLSNMFAAVE